MITRKVREQHGGERRAPAQAPRQTALQRVQQEGDEQRPGDRPEERREDQVEQVGEAKERDQREGARVEHPVRRRFGNHRAGLCLTPCEASSVLVGRAECC
jgi:hypothetical protein